jgi:D-serine deaminase-like pyridoxal phosphate-dependent protein
VLHPAFDRALTTAHIEDLHRAAARRRAIRLAGRVAHEPHLAATPIAMPRSASTRLRGRHVPHPFFMR